MSDIVDNRSELLVDHLNRILTSAQSARFAVGYFFVSGLEKVAESLKNVGEVRLLIGNTSNRETIEQMAEGYRRLEMVREVAEAQHYQKKAESKNVTATTAREVGTSLEVMDQTDEVQEVIKLLVRMIEEGRLKVRVYTKGRLHAKAYIFDYAPNGRYEKGVAIVGSSNFTLAGVAHNTELNVVVHGDDNHKQLGDWFEELWDESQDFDEALMEEMKQSWAISPARPHDIYMKTLYELVKDRLEGEVRTSVLAEDEITARLADFQRVAVAQAERMIREQGGAFVADVVGLGKSYIGAAIIKHFERTERARSLIICPRPLVEMWERYNEVYELNARVLSMGEMREDKNGIRNFMLEDVRYRDRDFVLVDESHNFRNRNIQRYRVLEEFLSMGKRCCFLTATPRNKSVWDIYNQLKLFHPDETTDLPIDPPHLKDYFKLVESGEKYLPDLLSNVLIRRTRNHVLRWYGYDAKTHQRLDPSRFDEYLTRKRSAYVLVDGRHQFFPRRRLATVEYSIEATYDGLYQELRGYIGTVRQGNLSDLSPDELTFARYGLWNYVKPKKRNQQPYTDLQRAGANLRGLIRVLLFKRFESSVYAFRETVTRLIRVHRSFIGALDEGIVPAGEQSQRLLYESDAEDETDLLDALRAVTGDYAVDDFDTELLKSHLEQDIRLLEKIRKLVEPITPERDAKLQRLKEKLAEPSLRDGKRLIFTQYADTARYLHENLNPGGKRQDVEVIYSGDKSKDLVVGRFAPKANPEINTSLPEIDTLVATDVLSEGLNMQDCDKIINYDLHWNPVRLVQRFGRIDRIGSEHDEIYGFNFLPETGIEENLGLQEKLTERIKEIQQTIGEDAAILDPSEKLNPEAMYAIYGQDEAHLSELEEEQEGIIDLNEAVEMFLQLRDENPGEFERIARLRDGIRSALRSEEKGLYVFCKAGHYQQLYLVDDSGDVVSRDTSRLLKTINCEPDEPTSVLPDDYNAAVMRVKETFAEEVKRRTSERRHRQTLSPAQRYTLDELQRLFNATEETAQRDKINALVETFRRPLSGAVQRELRRLRQRKVGHEELVKELEGVYSKYGLSEAPSQQATSGEEYATPRVVCSEALV